MWFGTKSSISFSPRFCSRWRKRASAAVAAQIAMHGVVLDGEPGAGDVFFLEVRQRFLKLLAPSGVAARDLLRRRTGLPDAQEPDPVKTQLCQAVQFGIGNVIQRRALPETAGQFRQPDAGVDLVSEG